MTVEHFRGVVWHRPKGALHQYVVVGVVVSDERLPVAEGNGVYLDGAVDILAALTSLPAFHANPERTANGLNGTANQVLLCLDRCEPATDRRCEVRR